LLLAWWRLKTFLASRIPVLGFIDVRLLLRAAHLAASYTRSKKRQWFCTHF
jgi:hypothetical protein